MDISHHSKRYGERLQLMHDVSCDHGCVNVLLKEVIEQRISAELKSVRDSLVLVERSAIDNLRNENEVIV